MMPRLPTTGLFSVDNYLRRNVASINPDVIWQWKDDNGAWRPYTAVDCRILEVGEFLFFSFGPCSMFNYYRLRIKLMKMK